MSPASLSRLALAAIALLMAAGPVARADPAHTRFWSELPGTAPVARAQTLPDFVELAAKLSPAVVNIASEPHESPASSSLPEGGSDPFHELPGPFERFVPHRSRSLGAGFVINSDGYVLTNDHVIENDKLILVTTQDGREYQAKLIGRDQKTDVALVKIDVGHPLASAPLGNSDDLRVGEWVMAIGDPYGFDHTVTAGIVSAKGRFIPGSYDDFIQTDASINPGNSGGPLINVHGEVVGLNSAIFTHTGHNMGIGFAIPINLIKDEIDQLRTSGKVVRGWLGIYVQKVTPDLAQSMGLKDARGALVSDVLKDGPGKAAGLQHGDVIVAFGDHQINDSQELPLEVGRTPVGATVTVKIIRNGTAKDVPIKITPSHEEELEKTSAPEEAGFHSTELSGLGLFVANLDQQIADQLGLNDKSGVVVSSVSAGSAAEEAGLHKRDLILEVNRQPVKDVAACQQAVGAAGKGATVLLLVKRGSGTVFVPIKPQG